MLWGERLSLSLKPWKLKADCDTAVIVRESSIIVNNIHIYILIGQSLANVNSGRPLRPLT